MNKTEFVGAVAAAASITKDEAAKAVEAVLSTIATTVAAGGDVRLTGFGVFEKKTRVAHEGRNPGTGAAISIPAKSTVKFRAGKDLEARL